MTKGQQFAAAPTLFLASLSLTYGHLVFFLVFGGLFIWVAGRVLAINPLLREGLRRAFRRRHLGLRAMSQTIATGSTLESGFIAPLAVARFPKPKQGHVGWPYIFTFVIVRQGRIANEALMKLSFYDLGDSHQLSQSVQSLVAAAEQLERIDTSLIRSSGGKATSGLRTLEPKLRRADDIAFEATLAQRGLESDFGGRDGPDGLWFQRVVAKRSEILNVLLEGKAAMVRIEEMARWMKERQSERGSDDEVELIDASEVRTQLADSLRLIAALSEGVGEVHLDPVTRL
jgi:hypothetical protein